MSKTLPAITCLVPPRLDAPVTLLSSASRAKGQILWPFVTCCCVLLQVVTFVTRNYCCNWLYNMIYTMHIIHIDILMLLIPVILVTLSAFSWIIDHSPDGDAGIMMAAVQVVLVVHIEACLIAPGRLQDRGYDGASRPEYFGTTWCQLNIRFAVAGMCWIWCVCFKLPYDNITHFFWKC